MQNPSQSQVQLIPKPQELRILDGNFFFTDKVIIKSSGVSDNFVSYLKDSFNELFDIKFVENDPKETPSLTLEIDKNLLNSKPDAYSLKINPDKHRDIFCKVLTIC